VAPVTYVLIPGAGGDAWYWHLVDHELGHRGHDVISVELPSDDDSAGLADYADTVVKAADDRRDVVLVAQSMGAFVVPLVHQRRPTSSIILVNAMIPLPGESPGAWWENTAKRRRGGPTTSGRAVLPTPSSTWRPTSSTTCRPSSPPMAWVMANGRATSRSARHAQFTAWPQVPTHVIAGRDDRFFPLDFQQRIARERLDLEPDIVPGGHLVALSQPIELANRIESYQDR
jgi:pimeloyl-ACP methyl ester carboxylesterase